MRHVNHTVIMYLGFDDGKDDGEDRFVTELSEGC